MLLAVDIGNTNITLGFLQEGEVQQCLRLPSDTTLNTDDTILALNKYFASAPWKQDQITDVILCSVVPSLTATIETALHKVLNRSVCKVELEHLSDIQVHTDSPEQVGIDRLVNAVAAYACYQKSLIILDFGTATTIDVLTHQGHFKGGIICAGFKITAEALFANTAQIASIPLETPQRLIGKNTTESVQSGLYYGYAGMIDSLLSQIKKELLQNSADPKDLNPLLIATGGLATLLLPNFSNMIYHEHLTLQGLYRIHTQIR